MLRQWENHIIQLHNCTQKVGDTYELDLTLRNNITTEEHPLGSVPSRMQNIIIRKENIRSDQVMGLAVLPARLKGEMELLEELEGKRYFFK